MLIVIVILAVLSALAAPSFSTILVNNRVRTGADGIVSGLQLARTEAIHRNSNISFTLNTASGWTVAAVSPASTVQTRPANEAGGTLQVSSLNDQTSLTFTAIGAVSAYNVATNLTKITVAAPSGAANVDSLQIDVSAGGQIHLCNLAITSDNDPRKC